MKNIKNIKNIKNDKYTNKQIAAIVALATVVASSFTWVLNANLFIKSDKNIIEGNGNIQGSTLTINNNAESLTDTIKKHRIKITDDMFNSIKLGMSYEDVCNIMQMKGVVMYEIENGNYISYKWGDDVFISLIADFKNNKLVRKVKT